MIDCRPRVLVVEDNGLFALGLRMNLEFEGYDVMIETDGSRAVIVPESWDPDVILLDLMLPGLDGIELLGRWRAANVKSRVIIVSARITDADVVTGLRLGADDYIRKPFGIVELLERIRVQLRSAERDAAGGRTDGQALEGFTLVDRGSNPQRSDADEAAVDVAAYADGFGRRPDSPSAAKRVVHVLGDRVSVGDREARVTATEMRILRMLAKAPGARVSRADLLELIGHQRALKSGTVNQHICRLRPKLNPIGAGLLVGFRGSYAWLVDGVVELH